MQATVRATLVAIGVLICLPSVRAQAPQRLFDGCQWTYPSLCVLWKQRKCWCPDDYLAKPLPCVRPNPRGCTDDYCPKNLPCVPPNPKGCVDDYCRKACPLLLPSNCEPWYTCGPPQNCMKSGCGERAP
jgi:hypothetical protein